MSAKQNTSERVRALNEIEDVLGIPANEIKNKITSVRSQLGRELSKMAKTKSGQSADELYQSTWAHFDRLKFLHPVVKPGKSKDTLDPYYEDSQREIIGNEDSSSESMQITSCTPKVSKRIYEARRNELIASCINVMKEPLHSTKDTGNEQQQCQFSLYISHKLSQFDKKKRALAEKRINDIIFDIEMSEFSQNTNAASNINHFVEGNYQPNGSMPMINGSGHFMTMIQQ